SSPLISADPLSNVRSTISPAVRYTLAVSVAGSHSRMSPSPIATLPPVNVNVRGAGSRTESSSVPAAVSATAHTSAAGLHRLSSRIASYAPVAGSYATTSPSLNDPTPGTFRLKFVETAYRPSLRYANASRSPDGVVYTTLTVSDAASTSSASSSSYSTPHTVGLSFHDTVSGPCAAAAPANIPPAPSTTPA